MSSTNPLLSVLAAATFLLQHAGAVNAQAVASPPVTTLQLAPNLPRVSSLTLTPIGPKRAALAVAFSRAERLPDSIPLSGLALTLKRKAGVANEFSAELTFDFDEFSKEQERRAELSRRGALTAIFEGRQIVRVVRVPFIDPALLRRLIAARRPIIIPPGLFNGLATTIDPARELMITSTSVVEDPTRTFDVCTGAGTQMGAWTFGKLVTDMANGAVDPAQMVEDWLKLWSADQTVNGFVVPARTAVQSVLSSWPRTANGKLDLAKAPLRLLAIVNRIDLRKNAAYGGGNAGEARFVFAVLNTAQCNVQQPFTVILEYGVPKSTCPAIHAWGQAWHDLGSIVLGSTPFNTSLQNLTDQFAGPNASPSKPNGSALNQLRTNEVALAFPWELREFHLDGTTHEFKEATVAQTPDLSFNSTAILKAYIDQNQSAILAHTNQVPLAFQGAPFLGGSSPNGPPTFPWNSSPAANSNDARHEFSLTTCSGCHGGETFTPFSHIGPRAAGTPAALSDFLLGNGTLAIPNTISKSDPVDGSVQRSYGDLLRRQQDLDALLSSSCVAGGFLRDLFARQLNFVH